MYQHMEALSGDGWGRNILGCCGQPWAGRGPALQNPSSSALQTLHLMDEQQTLCLVSVLICGHRYVSTRLQVLVDHVATPA